MDSPISPPPVTSYQPNSLPAYLSNGIIGLRVREIPLHNGAATVNGYSGEDPTVHVESTPFAPYPLGGDLCLGQTWLSSAPLNVQVESQSYDFSCGELHTTFTFAAEGVTARVQALTFCSRSLPTLALQEITVQVDTACDLGLRAAVDPTGIPGQWVSRTVRTPGSPKQVVDGALRWESLGGVSQVGVAYTTELLGANDVQPTYAEWQEQGPLATTYTVHAEPHHRYVLRQTTSMIPSTVHHAPDQQASRMAWLGKHQGFESVRQENREAWADLWRGRIHLNGAELRWQALADAAFYYLHSSVHPSSPCATSPYGLASWYNYTYYYGHIMWDLETFTYPALVFTYPEAAHAMLEYRVQRVPAARSNAKMYGYGGIQFPWQSNASAGDESTPLQSPNSVYEQHASLDVAFAFAQYAYATGDQGFIHDAVWPILEGVAGWITSRVTKTSRGYEILRMTGPAEEKGPVNNNAYVNMAATVVLRAASDCARRLGYTPPGEWEAVANGIVIPQDTATKVILNYDGYSPDQPGGATPSAAAGFYPLTYSADPAVERATLDYYVNLADKYIGAPMLSTLYGVFAARLGNRDQALQLLEKGYAAFNQEPFSCPGETPAGSPPHAGPFFSNLGGFLMDCLFGLPGLRLGPGDPQSWCERPIVLPTGWDSIEVERISVRGQSAHLLARQGDECAHIDMQPLEK
jgi:protein-glucosylgalactosylhydroxylysine glucosidase